MDTFKTVAGALGRAADAVLPNWLTKYEPVLIGAAATSAGAWLTSKLHLDPVVVDAAKGFIVLSGAAVVRHFVTPIQKPTVPGPVEEGVTLVPEPSIPSPPPATVVTTTPEVPVDVEVK